MALSLFSALSNNIIDNIKIVTDLISSNIIAQMTGLLLAGGTLYFVLFGFMLMGGYIQQPFSHFIKTVLKFGLIMGVVIGSGHYASSVVPALYSLQYGLAAMFTNQAAVGPNLSIFNFLDAGLEQTLELIRLVIEADRPWTAIGAAMMDLLIAMIIALSSVILFAIAGGYLIVSQAMFLIMLAIGPIFIAMLLFGGITSQWFDRWFAQTLTYILQLALVSMVALFGVKIFSNLLGENYDALTAIALLGIALQMVVTSLILVKLLAEANNVAGSLAGGISSGAVNLIGIATATAAAAFGGAKSVGKGARSMYKAGQNLRDGRSRLNPAYNRQVKKAMSERRQKRKVSWGTGKNSIKKA